MEILADSKRRATEYWFSRRSDIDAANEQIRQILADPSRQGQIGDARKHLADLNKPVDTLYVEMQERLNGIPDRGPAQGLRGRGPGPPRAAARPHPADRRADRRQRHQPEPADRQPDGRGRPGRCAAVDGARVSSRAALRPTATRQSTGIEPAGTQPSFARPSNSSALARPYSGSGPACPSPTRSCGLLAWHPAGSGACPGEQIFLARFHPASVSRCGRGIYLPPTRCVRFLSIPSPAK